MDIKQSELFQQHEVGKEYLAKKAELKPVKWLLASITIAGFVLLIITLSVGAQHAGAAISNEVPDFLVHTFWVGILLFFGGLLPAGFLGDAQEARVRFVEKNADLLAKLMGGVRQETFLSLSIDQVRSAGKHRLVDYARALLMLQDEIKGMQLGGISAYLSNFIHSELDDELSRRNKEISVLYDALRKFDLVPEGGYGWVFDEARKLLGQKSK